jgi:DNA polymerase III delta prime subunit
MELWTEKYRPKSIKDYVWRDQQMKNSVEQWLQQKNIPNILLVGRPGTGKSTLAKILINELNVHESDVLWLNASRERNADAVQEKIIGFCETYSLGDSNFKIVVLDEFDNMSQLAYNILRGEIDRFSDSVRFICTANYINKISPPILSRLQVLEFGTLDPEQFLNKIVTVLTDEKIKFSDDNLLKLYTRVYPDARKALQELQQYSINGELVEPVDSSQNTDDYLKKTAELFKMGKAVEARKYLVANAKTDNYEEIFRWMYENLNIWGDNDGDQNTALIYIRDGYVKHHQVADVEINLAATFAQLTGIRK